MLYYYYTIKNPTIRYYTIVKYDMCLLHPWQHTLRDVPDRFDPTPETETVLREILHNPL